MKKDLREIALSVFAWGVVLGTAMAQEEGKVVVISEQVGEVIDLEERNYFKMFLATKDFQSAVFLQRPDSNFMVKISYLDEGISKERLRNISQEDFFYVREYLDHFEEIERGTYTIMIPKKEERKEEPFGTRKRKTVASCFRGRPLPKCQSFWITESGYSRSLDPQHIHYFTWELGWMTNLNERSALGTTIFLGTPAEDGLLIGLKPRFRYWLNSTISLDFSPGILLSGNRIDSPGFTSHVGLNFGDWFILTSFC